MKKLIRMTLVTAFAFAAGYSVYQSQKEVTLSDLALENVEALASGESASNPCTYAPNSWCRFVVATPDGNRIESHWARRLSY